VIFVDARQPDVEQHEIDVFFVDHLQCGLAGRGAEHAVIALEQCCERVAHSLVIVNNQHGFSAFRHRRREYS
jgi:hypothetical protein